MTKEKFKVAHSVFDNFTNRTLFKLICSGRFKGLESPISVGKESNIFSAITEKGTRVIVKIYRLETCDFNRMYGYIRDDPRFHKLKRKKRKIIFAWVEREYHNLLRAQKGKVNAPQPIAYLNNVLVLEFIGKDNEIAPKLKDKMPKNKKQFFNNIIGNIKKLYKAGLVHGDLSAFNILNFEDKPIFIDFSQATMLEHPMAAELLERDVENICAFFGKQGLERNAKKIIEAIKKINQYQYNKINKR
jgi:RIO kinase 1